MKRIINFACLLLLMIGLLPNIQSYAHNRSQHNQDIQDVLLSPNYNNQYSNLQEKKTLKALQAAIYLANDQFNGDGSEDLDYLRNKLNIQSIITDISEIDYKASSSTHRSFTHRGWDFTYPRDLGHWEKRKKILFETVKNMFGFDVNSKSKCNSFCAILYYTHVLGDHIADKKYYGALVQIDIGGRSDNNDIINELKKHCSILFKSQQYSLDYILFMSSLDSINRKVAKLDPSGIGINASNFTTYHEYSVQLMKTMKKYIPKLLKKEPFFKVVFYPDIRGKAA